MSDELGSWNTLSHPKYLSELKVSADKPYCIVALLRYLQGSAPSKVEQQWATQEELSKTANSWVEMREYGEPVGYIILGDGSGRYSSILPDGVDPAKIPKIELPQPPPTQLRHFLATMIDALGKENLKAAADFSPYRDLLMQSDADVGYLETRTFISALASGGGLVLESLVMEEYERHLLDKYLGLALRGGVVGVMLMLARTSQAAGEEQVLSNALKLLPGVPVHDMVGWGDFILSGVAQQNNGMLLIRKALDGMAEDGEKLLDQASAAKKIGDFYGPIFASMPFFYGCKRGYGFLAKTDAGSDIGELRRLANICDERFALAGASMKIQFANSMDQRYTLAHRLWISVVRAQRGEVAAAEIGEQLVGVSMMYPEFQRGFLLGETDALTMAL